MHRLIVWLIAVAFVFNGAASLAWLDLPETPPVAAHHDGARAGGHGVLAHQQTDDFIVVVPDHCHGSSNSDNRLKCCGTCSLASLVPDIVATAMTFADKGVTFHTGPHDLVGHLVAVEPGVPKILV